MNQCKDGLMCKHTRGHGQETTTKYFKIENWLSRTINKQQEE